MSSPLSLVRGPDEQDGKPFYSAVDEAINALPQPKGTAEQYLSMISKAPGVKQAEIRDRGLDKALTGKLTKDQLKQIAQQNPAPQVEERVLGEMMPGREFDQWMDNWSDKNDQTETAKAIRSGLSWDDIAQVAEREGHSAVVRLIKNQDSPAKYRKYTIPGGENYREVLLKLPDDTKPMTFQEWVDNGMQGEWSSKGIQNTKPKFQSKHYDDPNILAHARVSDRTGPNGEKILHVEEIQSDWHQKGREEGYQSSDLTRAENEFKKYRDELAAKYDLNPRQKKVLSMYATEKRMDPSEVARYEQLHSDWTKAKAGVPDAPFKKNWHELAMKRLLDDAARNGYDKVVVTPGAEQVKRYDLSKQVGEIYSWPDGETEDGKELFGLSIYTPDNNAIVEQMPHTISDIRRLLGKEVTEKILRREGQALAHEPETRMLSGLDLQVGGEGMKGFYDKILPDFLNNYGKKYGVKVQPHSHQMAGSETPLHSFDIHPKMREDILSRGQPLYKKGGSAHLDTGGPVEGMRKLYHGTPHRFPPTEKNTLGEFDPTKIGTGEGAQAYGHGHYLAEAVDLAKAYRDKLTDVGGGPVKMDYNSMIPRPRYGSIADAKYHMIKAIDDLKARAEAGDKNALASIPAYMKRIEEIEKKGHLYHIHVPHEHIDRMLDWDKPLSEQHPDVQKFVRQHPEFSSDELHVITHHGQDATHWSELADSPEELKSPKYWNAIKKALFGNPKLMPYGEHAMSKTTGEEFYNKLANPSEWSKQSASQTGKLGMHAEDASEILRKAGIPGIKYFDSSSRGAGGTGKWKITSPDGSHKIYDFKPNDDVLKMAGLKAEPYGTRNLVIFPGNEHLMQIVHREKKGGVIHNATGGRTSIVPMPNRWFIHPDKNPKYQELVKKVLKAKGGDVDSMRYALATRAKAK